MRIPCMRQYLFTAEVGLMMPKPKRGIKKRLMNKLRSLFSRQKSPSRRLRRSDSSSNPAPTKPTMTEKLSSVRNTQPGKHAAPRGIRFSRRAVQRSKYLREKFGVRKTVMGFSPRVGSITEEDESEITLWRLAENAENVISNGLVWLQSDFKDYDSDDDDDDDEKILQKWIENNSFDVMQDNVDADDKPLSDDDDGDDDDDDDDADDDVFESDETQYKVEQNNDGINDDDDDKTDDYDESDDDDDDDSDDSDGIITYHDANCHAISDCVNYDNNSNNTLGIDDSDDHKNSEVLQCKDNANDDDNEEHGSTQDDSRPGSSLLLKTYNVDDNANEILDDSNHIHCKRYDISEDNINNNNQRGDDTHHNHESKMLIACKGKESAINTSSSYKCNYVDINSNDCLHHLTITDRPGPKDKLCHHNTTSNDIKRIQTVSKMHAKGRDNQPRDLNNHETANCQNKMIFDEYQRSREKKSCDNLWTVHYNGSVDHSNYNQVDDDDNDYVWVSDVIRDVTSASKSDVTAVDYDGRPSDLKRLKSKSSLQNTAGSSILTNIDNYDNSALSNSKDKYTIAYQQLPYSSVRGREPETIEETDTLLTYTKPESHEASKAKKLSCGEDESDMHLDNVLNSVKEEIEDVWTRISTLENDFHFARTTMNNIKTSKKK